MRNSEPKKTGMQIVERLKQRRAYLKFSKQYRQVGFKPNLLELIKVLLLTIPKKSDLFDFSTHKQIVREWQGNRHPDNLSNHSGDLPSIEILTVVAGKDLELLTFSITSAIERTLNPVSMATFIIPARDLDACKEIVEDLEIDVEIRIVIEDTLLNEDTRTKLRNRFGQRYGWVLQQLLADSFILKSNSAGVLLLNSDTILMRKAAWLESDGNQKLLVALEYHPPYYKLLNQLIGSREVPSTTHVTHHMLFQPNYFRAIFNNYGISNVESLADWLIANADPNADSPLCVEFELYAQAMLKMHPEKIQLRKFSNISVERSDISALKDLYSEYSNFNSISMHSYLESESH